MIEMMSSCSEGDGKSDSSLVILPFGKYKGETLGDVYLKDRGYLVWLSNQEWVIDNERINFLETINKILNN